MANGLQPQQWLAHAVILKALKKLNGKKTYNVK